MFSLIVNGCVANEGSLSLKIDRTRFLEYTSVAISRELRTLSLEAIESLKSWPCLLMNEGTSDEVAFLVQIDDVVDRGRNSIIVTTRQVPCSPTLINKAVWEMRHRLDIEEFEFHRGHWSIKEVDLIGTLASNNYLVDSSWAKRPVPQSLPGPTRDILVAAKDIIGGWSHLQIDGFLIEAGVEGLIAGKEVGSRQERANSIVSFALANPEAVTADNHLFSAFIVRKAQQKASWPTVSFSELPTADIPKQESRVSVPAPSRSPNRVFVVHGRNETARVRVVELLRSIGLEAIVLHEQPNMGRHLLTKFIGEADLVTFAVVLMTDDDVGGRDKNELKPRARQNVILELGYFLAHLGQHRVCALISPDLETPSDFDGIVYIRMGSDDAWKHELIRELRAAEMPVRSE